MSNPVSRAARSGLSLIFFDFDGVILESSNVKTQAFAQLFRDLPASSVDAILEHHRANAGISRYRKFEWIYETLLGKTLSAAKREELGRRFSNIVLQQILDAPFVPGAKEALEALHENLPLYIVSGTPQGELEFIVTERGLSQFFKGVYGSPHTKPAVVRELLGHYAIPPDRALFIGDGPSDFQAAAETGVHFLARDSDEQHDFWMDVNAELVSDLTDIADRVATWTKAY